MKQLNTDLHKLLIELEGFRDEYKERMDTNEGESSKAFAKGKFDAYVYASKKLRSTLKWYGAIKY